jgi:hypothetical protein
MKIFGRFGKRVSLGLRLAIVVVKTTSLFHAIREHRGLVALAASWSSALARSLPRIILVLAGLTCSLAGQDYTLSVTNSQSGLGTGTVVSSPAGINCPGTCTASFAAGTSVTVTGEPNPGSQFIWKGACSGIEGSCSVTMGSDQSVTATFFICYVVNPVAQFFSVTGGSGAVNVAYDSGCQLTATSDSDWLTIKFPTGGNLYYSAVANTGPLRVGTITFSGGVTVPITEKAAGDTDQSLMTTLVSGLPVHPVGVAYDSSGNLFVAGVGGDVVVRVDAVTGAVTTVAGNGSSAYSGDGGPATSAGMFPWAVAVDGSGNLLIADQQGSNGVNSRIRRVDAKTGIVTTAAGGGSGTCGTATDTVGDGCAATAANLTVAAFGSTIALDSLGDIFVADTQNNRVRRIDAVTGIITTVAGTGGYGATGSRGDGGRATNAVVNPFDVAVDTEGNLYIAEEVYIRKVTASDGIISTIAGNGTIGCSGDDGPAVNAGFNLPSGLTTDGAGNLFIAEFNGEHIRRIDSTTGIITTVAGNGTPGSAGDGGPATNAYLLGPADVIFNGTGNLMIADSTPARIRRVGSDFSVNAAPGGSTSASITAGQTATYNLQVSPLEASAGAVGLVSIGCSGAPAKSTCIVSSSALTVGATSPIPFTVNVTTTPPSGSLAAIASTGVFPWQWLAGVLAVFLVTCRNISLKPSRPSQTVRTGLLVLGLTLLTGCGGGNGSGGGGGNTGTPVGTYTLTVSGSYGSATHSVNLTLTVN